jgi:ribonuclease HI
VATEIYTSTATRDGRRAAGVAIRDAGGMLRVAGRPLGDASADEAAYRAILRGLWMARRLGARRASVFTEDAQIAAQLNGQVEVPPSLVGLYLQTKAMMNAYRWSSVQLVPRAQNAEAVLAAAEALDRTVIPGAYDEEELEMPLWLAAETARPSTR